MPVKSEGNRLEGDVEGPAQGVANRVVAAIEPVDLHEFVEAAHGQAGQLARITTHTSVSATAAV
jgi:hypothetical protein